MQFEYRLHGFLEWSLVGEEEECDDDEIYVGRKETVDGCVTACFGRSSMFIFGTNDFGGDRCNGNGCKCFCESSAENNGTCGTVTNKGYRLYRFGTSSKY